MSIFENPENLRLLRNLLQEHDENNSDSDSDTEGAAAAAAAPLTQPRSGTQFRNQAKSSPMTLVSDEEEKPLMDGAANAAAAETEQAIANIEEWQEYQQREDADLLDTRKRPEYKMRYQQAVTTEDIYLQMGNRTSATSSCEKMILEIQLPDETDGIEKMSLNITPNSVDLGTSMYRLNLPLVHSVVVDSCKAQYMVAERKLTLTLLMQREFDFINF